MKLSTWGTAALAACFLTATAAQSHAANTAAAEQSAATDVVDLGSEMEGIEQTSYNQVGFGGVGGGVGLGGYGSSFGGGGGYGGGSFMNRPMQLIFGVEYIYAQATFSDALAFVRQDAANGTEDWVQYDFDYESSYGVYGGVYLPDCGGALIFGYRNLQSTGDFFAPEGTGFVDNFAPFELVGDLSGRIDVDVDTYDVGMSKTIPLGCLQTCGNGCSDCTESCCNDPCNPCGGGRCPAWDITFSGGIRAADVGWNALSQGSRANANAITSVNQSLQFDGFGGRVGLMGRRYIGRQGLFSLYARGDWSVLFGDCDIAGTIRDADANPVAITRKSNDLTVPVTEIELGGTAHMGQHLALSAGWFWSAWHDLGMSQTYGFVADGGGGVNVQQFQTTHFDDANILGFNGFFARAEMAF